MRETFPEVIDSTMRSAFVACPRKFYWQYIHEIAPDGENVHLHAGGCFARGLEVARKSFFGLGKPLEDSVLDGAEALLQMWGNFDPGEGQNKTIDRVLGAYELYHTIWPMPTDNIQPHMTPRGPAVEFNFVLPIPGTLHPTTGNPILYAGRCDMIGMLKGQDSLFVVDEKTTSQLGPTWGNQWQLRAQFTGYVWGAQQFGLPVNGAVIRGISILKEKYGNAESIVYRQEWQIQQWLDTLRRDVERMIQAWKEWKQEQDLSPWTLSLDQACSAYGGCPMMRLCDSPNPEGFVKIYYKEHKWDPTKRPSGDESPVSSSDTVQSPAESMPSAGDAASAQDSSTIHERS